VFLKNLLSLIKSGHSKTDDIQELDQKLVFNVHKKYVPRVRQLKYARLFLTLSEKILLGFGALLFIIGLSWWSTQFATTHRINTPATGGTYREGIVGTPQHLNPLYSSLSAVDAAASKLVFSSIMRYNNEGKLVNDIATELSTDEKETTYTVAIRSDVKFHDGTPLTANDIAFTIERIKNEESKSPLRQQLFNVATEVINDHKLTITLEDPFEQFRELLTFGILPQHVWNDIEPKDMSASPLNIKPIGSGPYVFEELSTDDVEGISTIRMIRNENFYRTPPHISAIEIKAAATNNQVLDLFLKQEIDGLAALSAEESNRLGEKRANQYTFAAPEYTGIFFNQLLNVSLKKQTVRDALSYAIDKQKIVDETLAGRAQVAHSPFIEGMPGYIEGEHTTDIEKAVHMLDDDNWERVSREEFLTAKVEEILEDWTAQYKETHEEAEPAEEEVEQARSGFTETTGATLDALQPYFRKRNNTYLEVNLSHVDTDDATAIAHSVKAAWRSLGVHVTLTPIPGSLLERETLKSHAYEALLVGVVLSTNPDPYPLWYDAGNESRATLARFIDRRLDDLLEASRNTKDKKKKADLYTQFQEFIIKNKPAIILYNPTYHYAVHPKVMGITEGRIITPVDRFADIEKWYIKSKKKWSW